jgi:LPXTG-motif cell wall-anchored protein
MHRLLASVALAAAVLLVPATAGATEQTTTTVDYGPPPGIPEVDCDTVTIDPPEDVWVTFAVDVNGTVTEVDNDNEVPTEPPWFRASISHLTTATGPLTISARARWNIGTGWTPWSEPVTLVCHEPPTTTTEPPTTTTTVPETTTTTEPPPETTTTTAPPETTSPPTEPPTTPPGELPETGSSPFALLLGAAALLGSGGIATVARRFAR